MSRHTAMFEKEDGTYINLAWGFDPPMSTYFIQGFNAEDECVFDIDTRFTSVCHPDYPNKLTFSKGEMLEVFEKYKKVIPEAHVSSLVLDIPF